MRREIAVLMYLTFLGFLASRCSLIFTGPYVPGVRGRLAVSPNGKQLALDLGGMATEEIHLMSVDGTDQFQFYRASQALGYVPKGATFSPDGSLLAYEMFPSPGVPQGQERSQIYLCDVAANACKRLTQNPHLDAGPAFSPDGTKIAFFRALKIPRNQLSNRFEWDLFELELAGRKERRLSNQKFPFWSVDPPSYSPDGDSIVFSGAIGVMPSTRHIYLLRTDSQGPAIKLTSGADLYSWPIFSPDGRKIALVRTHNVLTYDIWTMNPDGADFRQVTKSGFVKRSPAFSPDGTKIYFRGDSEESGKEALWVVNLPDSVESRIRRVKGT